MKTVCTNVSKSKYISYLVLSQVVKILWKIENAATWLPFLIARSTVVSDGVIIFCYTCITTMTYFFPETSYRVIQELIILSPICSKDFTAQKFVSIFNINVCRPSIWKNLMYCRALSISVFQTHIKQSSCCVLLAGFYHWQKP